MIFPKHKSFNSITYLQQLEKIIEEVEEAIHAIKHNDLNKLEELFDVVHASETLLRKLQNDLQVGQYDEHVNAVINKNKQRGYYEQQ